MSSSISKGKNIFSKISSKDQRDQVFLNAIKDVNKFICKGVKESLYYYTPTRVLEDGSLQGKIEVVTGEVILGDSIANFSTIKEKYFYQTKIDFQNSQNVLLPSENLFMLKRRQFARVSLLNAEERSVIIIAVNAKKTFIDAECLDISLGGTRIKLPLNPIKLALADKLVAVLRVNGKRIEVKSEICHIISDSNHILLGLKFSEDSDEIKSILQMLVLEFQRKAINQI